MGVGGGGETGWGVGVEGGEGGRFDGVEQGDSARVVDVRVPGIMVSIEVTKNQGISASKGEQLLEVGNIARRAGRDRREITVNDS